MRFSYYLLAALISCTTTVLAAEAPSPSTLSSSSTTVNNQASASSEVKKYNHVNVNTADAKQISSTLKNIGMKRAKLIIEYREQHGAFKTVDDLKQIKGLGKKFIEENKNKITF